MTLPLRFVMNQCVVDSAIIHEFRKNENVEGIRARNPLGNAVTDFFDGSNMGKNA